MEKQNYANHRRFVPLYHYVLTGLVLIGLIGSGINLFRAVRLGSGRASAGLILLLFVCVLIAGGYSRIFALKAQDRAIRVEENLRNFVLYGSLLDPTLGMRQIIGLRFASDAEFEGLAKRAVDEDLSEDAIKKAIQDWRGDHDRV